MPAEWRSLVTAFAEHCAAAGLDVAHPFSVAMFNRVAPESERLPDFGRSTALAMIVGNTRALWQRLKSTLAAAPHRIVDLDPLDDYVMENIRRACEALPIASQIVWAHVTEPTAVPIQRVALAAHLTAISPSHLSVHPVFGPWLALRAVVVFDLDAPSIATTPLVSPCDACAKPCVAVLEAALARAQAQAVPLGDAIRRDWRGWAAIRDACPVGRAARYSDAQLEYHYTKNKRLLELDRDGSA